MASSFQQWESDPLFSAAEVVQDSADRVESLFRLLLHEESLSKGYRPEMKLQHSIEYHRRDLVTILETAKWQLEDFEREVNLLAMADNSQEKQNVIYRHRQFIRAIREQIMNVKKSMEKLAVGESARNNEWVNLNEQDRDGLALFLSGGAPVKNSRKQDTEGDARMFRKFLDPVGYSSITEEITEQNSESSNIKGFGLRDPNLHSRDNDELRNGVSEIDFEAPSTQENACRRDEVYDLEANEAKPRTFSKQNKVRSYYSKVNPFRTLMNFIPSYASGGGRSITKRWKDGEERTHSRSGNTFSCAIQSYLGQLSLAQRCRNIQFSPQEVFAGIMYSGSWARFGMERCTGAENLVTQKRFHSAEFCSMLDYLLSCQLLGLVLCWIHVGCQLWSCREGTL